MRRAIRLMLCCVAGIVLGTAAPPGRADSSKPPPPIGQFEVLIGRIRAAAASKAWQEPGWKDEKIEAALQELVEAAKTASGREFLKLPVTLEDVGKPVPPGGARPFARSELHVASESDHVAFANGSIYLIDGSIDISHAANCIVVARGIVEIGHCNNCVVVAGHHVNIGHTNNRGAGLVRPDGPAPPPPTEGSLIVSGGTLNIGFAIGTTLSAPRQVVIAHAQQVAFLASPNVAPGNHQFCTEHKDFKSPLGIPLPEALPKEVFKINQVVARDGRSKHLITVERGGLEYVLRPGAKLVDEKGQSIEGWTNWKLEFVTEDAALFSDGERDRSVYLPGQ